MEKENKKKKIRETKKKKIGEKSFSVTKFLKRCHEFSRQLFSEKDRRRRRIERKETLKSWRPMGRKQILLGTLSLSLQRRKRTTKSNSLFFYFFSLLLIKNFFILAIFFPFISILTRFILEFSLTCHTCGDTYKRIMSICTLAASGILGIEITRACGLR